MKIITVSEFKSKLAQILKIQEFVVSYGKQKRKLGVLDGKMILKFNDDWEMSDDGLLNS